MECVHLIVLLPKLLELLLDRLLLLLSFVKPLAVLKQLHCNSSSLHVTILYLFNETYHGSVDQWLLGYHRWLQYLLRLSIHLWLLLNHLLRRLDILRLRLLRVLLRLLHGLSMPVNLGVVLGHVRDDKLILILFDKICIGPEAVLLIL